MIISIRSLLITIYTTTTSELKIARKQGEQLAKESDKLKGTYIYVQHGNFISERMELFKYKYLLWFIIDAEAQRREASNTLKNLERTHERVQKDHEKFKEKCDKYKTAIHSLEKEKEMLKKEVSDLSKEMSILSAKNEEATKAASLSSSTLEETQEEAVRWKIQAGKLESDLEQSKKQQDKSSEKIGRLEMDVVEAKELQAQTKQELEELNLKHEQICSELERVQQEVQEAEATLFKKEEELASATEQLQALGSQLRETEEAQQHDRKELQDEIDRLNHQLMEANFAIEEKDAKARAYEAQSEQQVELLEGTLTAQVEKLTKDLDIERSERELEVMQLKMQLEAAGDAKEVESRLKTMKAAYEQQLEELQTTKAKADGEAEKFKQRAAKFSTKVHSPFYCSHQFIVFSCF